MDSSVINALSVDPCLLAMVVLLLGGLIYLRFERKHQSAANEKMWNSIHDVVRSVEKVAVSIDKHAELHDVKSEARFDSLESKIDRLK